VGLAGSTLWAGFRSVAKSGGAPGSHAVLLRVEDAARPADSIMMLTQCASTGYPRQGSGPNSHQRNTGHLSVATVALAQSDLTPPVRTR
jgi:hypothetical protein